MVSLCTPHGGWSTSIESALTSLAVTPTLGGFTCPRPSAQDRAQLATYLEQVVTWNARHNLTAARSAEELVDLFVVDAAVLAGAFADAPLDARDESRVEPERRVDVGSGAGAPGLPLAILTPRSEMTLVEPRAKRVAFLRSVVGQLDLRNVSVRRALSEDLAPQSFDTAMSRATMSPEDWLLEGSRVARSAIWVLLAEATPPNLPGWRPEVDLTYCLPLTEARRRAVRFVKDEFDQTPV